MEFFCCMDSMEFLCCMDVHFFRMVYIKFHTKSWVCSSKNGWVIANFMVHGIFLAWIYMQIFLYMDVHFSGWSIQISMLNPNYLAPKMAELELIPWSMEYSCMDSMPIFLCMDAHFDGTVHVNFHAKSRVCSSKNDWVIANSMIHRIFLHGFSCRFFFAWMPIFLDGPYKFSCKIQSL